MIRSTLSACVLAATLLGGCAAMSSAEPPVKVTDGVLVNRAGMTLYTFDRDPVGAGKSVCNGQCAANWPPLAAPADAKASEPYSIVVRDDGTRQWAYKGKPLYLWVRDQKPGDRTGDGVNGVWRLARP